ncbi:MAG: fbpA 3 [Herminiimonas sp.]|nr:fbpA 3 [Herminiimonas sp.]
MNNSIIKAGAASLLFVLSLVAAVPAFAQSNKTESAVAEIALYQGQNRQQRLIEGARKEGELSLYHSMPPEDMGPLIEAFTKKYGIKVKDWRASSSSLTQRITTEARGGRFEVDIVEDNGPGVEAVYREKLLQQVRSPNHDNMMPAAILAHKEWVGYGIDVFVQAYNTNKVKKEELPKSYQDLLDPKWKGRLGIEAEDQDWFAVLVQELGQEKGTKLFKDIVDTNGISVRKGHSLLTQMVASGEVPLGLTIYNYKPAQLKQKGAPIESFIIPPGIAYFRGIGLLKKAPHPHAALLFYDFMLSDEAQQILAKRFNVPASRKIDTPEKKMQLKFIDPGLSLDMMDKWTKAYEDAVIKRVRQ